MNLHGEAFRGSHPSYDILGSTSNGQHILPPDTLLARFDYGNEQPSEQATGPDSHHFSWFTRATHAAVAVLGVSATCGAEPGREGTPEPLCRPSAVDVGSKEKDRALQRSQAERCAAAMKSGQVALVNFGASAVEAREVGKRIADNVRRATDGLVRFSVEVVPSTEAAEAQWRASLAGGSCVNSSDQLASLAADRAMPELGEYDFVMSINNAKSCTPDVSGHASPLGRHADIFRGAAVDEYSGQSDPVFLAQIGAHEAGHLFGLGHDSTYAGPNLDGSFSPLPLEPPATTLNLNEYVKGGEYREYGSGTLMGDDVGRIGPVQQSCLNWAQEMLVGDAAGRAEPVTTSGATITLDEANNRRFAKIVLTEPLEIVSDTGIQSSYASVMVVPRVDPSSRSRLHGAELVLADERGCRVTRLGLLGKIGAKPERWTFKIGDDAYIVALSPKQLKVVPGP